MVGSSFFFEFTLPRFFMQVVGEIFCQLATSIPPWQVLKGHSIVSKCHYGLQGINPDEWVLSLPRKNVCILSSHVLTRHLLPTPILSHPMHVPISPRWAKLQDTPCQPGSPAMAQQGQYKVRLQSLGSHGRGVHGDHGDHGEVSTWLNE